MAYTMIHILVADIVLEYIPNINDYSTYILGTIAPDAVHANKDYSVALKEKSHLFTPELAWGKIDNWHKAEVWLENIEKYYREYQEKYNRDFLVGYIVHLLVDVYNSMYFYTPFIHSIEKDYEESFEKYKREAYEINYYLFSMYSKKRNLLEILKNGKAVSLEGVIEKEDIVKRIDFLFDEEFRKRDVHVHEHSICTISGIEQLMQGAVKFVEELHENSFCAPWRN